MPKAIELAVITDNVCWVDADLLVLKHAAGFYGADEAVANALIQDTALSLGSIAKQIKEEGHFVTSTNQAIRAANVLFVRTPGLVSSITNILGILPVMPYTLRVNALLMRRTLR